MNNNKVMDSNILESLSEDIDNYLQENGFARFEENAESISPEIIEEMKNHQVIIFDYPRETLIPIRELLEVPYLSIVYQEYRAIEQKQLLPGAISYLDEPEKENQQGYIVSLDGLSSVTSLDYKVLIIDRISSLINHAQTHEKEEQYDALWELMNKIPKLIVTDHLPNNLGPILCSQIKKEKMMFYRNRFQPKMRPARMYREQTIEESLNFFILLMAGALCEAQSLLILVDSENIAKQILIKFSVIIAASPNLFTSLPLEYFKYYSSDEEIVNYLGPELNTDLWKNKCVILSEDAICGIKIRVPYQTVYTIHSLMSDEPNNDEINNIFASIIQTGFISDVQQVNTLVLPGY